MATVEELLNDPTPWGLADIARELGMHPQEVVVAARRALAGETENERTFPAPGAEAPGRWLRAPLLGFARGTAVEPGPQWPAGVMRGWGRRCARLDHVLNLRPQRPTSRTRRR